MVCCFLTARCAKFYAKVFLATNYTNYPNYLELLNLLSLRLLSFRLYLTAKGAKVFLATNYTNYTNYLELLNLLSIRLLSFRLSYFFLFITACNFSNGKQLQKIGMIIILIQKSNGYYRFMTTYYLVFCFHFIKK